jgi:hypothetical protein
MSDHVPDPSPGVPNSAKRVCMCVRGKRWEMGRESKIQDIPKITRSSESIRRYTSIYNDGTERSVGEDMGLERHCGGWIGQSQTHSNQIVVGGATDVVGTLRHTREIGSLDGARCDEMIERPRKGIDLPGSRPFLHVPISETTRRRKNRTRCNNNRVIIRPGRRPCRGERYQPTTDLIIPTTYHAYRIQDGEE